MQSHPRCARQEQPWRQLFRGASCGLLWCLYSTRLRCLAREWSGRVEVVEAGNASGLVSGMVLDTVDSGVCARCIEISVSLEARAPIPAPASSSLLLAMSKTWLSGEVPQDWPAGRQGKMSLVKTLPRPSLVEMHTSLVY